MSRKVPIFAVVALIGIVTPASLPAAQLAPQPAAVATPGIITFTPQMKMDSLAGRADTDIVAFPNGRQVRVRDLRRLEAAKQKMQTPYVNPRSAALTVKPAATGKLLMSRADLLNALKLPDSDTVKLPSGQLVTIGQIKAVQPEVEKRLGRRLDAAAVPPNLKGPAIKISTSTTKAEWEDLFRNKPDTTILESPNGKRITLGELRQQMPKKKGALRQPPALPQSSPLPQGVKP
jgi:hypothetical protein